jgi:threonine dehydrogenase-like Zn-dependent dehydrogenase
MTVVPGEKGTARVEEVPDPNLRDGALLVRGFGVGVCGTEREIADGCGCPKPGSCP